MKFLNGLLPLIAALLFAIFAFEMGSRYGGVQTGTYSLARELGFPTQVLMRGGFEMQSASMDALLERMDHLIGTAAERRELWYLSSGAREVLDASLAQALKLRGDAVLKRFEFSQEELDTLMDAGRVRDPEQYRRRLAELRAALERARADLLSSEAEAG